MTVTELNSQVRGEIERRFANVWVEGEIVNFAAARSGHWYFTLHDVTSQLRAACYKGSNYRIRFQPFDGLHVRVRGRLTLYEPRGEYQILVESLEPVGEGALKVAFEQIKKKLEKEGLFAEELKRPLPAFPKRVGVVTSPTGAAFFDILHVLSRRARSVSVVLIPTLVQGESAGGQISAAIKYANQFNSTCDPQNRIDVLIVGRGGGSAEDLWAFNEELVARTIRASEIPVISAVGHEIDFTIADFVADLRAATPSAAAEVVAQREEDIEAWLTSRTDDLLQIINYKLLHAHSNLQELAMSPIFSSIPGKIKAKQLELNVLTDKFRSSFADRLKRSQTRLESIVSQLSPVRLASKVGDNRTRLEILAQRNDAAVQNVVNSKLKSLKICMATLDALSPLAVLERGFSIAQKESGEIIRYASQAAEGEIVNIRLANGKLKTKVISTEKEQ